MGRKLDRTEVPAAAFELARERTGGLIDELGFYYRRSKYIQPGDAIGDLLACAYLQGCNDTVAVLAKRPAIDKELAAMSLGFDPAMILRASPK